MSDDSIQGVAAHACAPESIYDDRCCRSDRAMASAPNPPTGESGRTEKTLTCSVAG